MEKVAKLAKSALKLNGEVSVTFVERGKPSTIAFTGTLAVDLDERSTNVGTAPA